MLFRIKQSDLKLFQTSSTLQYKNNVVHLFPSLLHGSTGEDDDVLPWTFSFNLNLCLFKTSVTFFNKRAETLKSQLETHGAHISFISFLIESEVGRWLRTGGSYCLFMFKLIIYW